MSTCSTRAADCCLVIFARYPEAGRCKTRLIPALGEIGAAELHHEMVEHTIRWAKESLAALSSIDLHIHFYGGSEPLMRSTFEVDASWQIVPQAPGDLGEKLRSATQRCQEQGYRQVLFVGTDCPQLAKRHAAKAQQALDEHACCFAPARDGGYTLLGMRLDQLDELSFALFENIPWGTGEVLAKSLDQLLPLELPIRILETLEDVDEPEDLHVWRRAKEPTPNREDTDSRLTVLIPCLDHEPMLDRALQAAREAANQDVEILVVGAGDCAHSLKSAVAHRAEFLCSPQADRSAQLNLGLQHASGTHVLLLHADTLLPENYDELLFSTLANEEVVAGAFALRLDAEDWRARWVERGVSARSRWLGMPYGDQALFARKRTLEELGGIPQQPLMDDYELVRQLKRKGTIQLIPAPVVTSARRWQQLGYLRTTLINQLIVLGYHLGFPVEQLAKFYRGEDKRTKEDQG